MVVVLTAGCQLREKTGKFETEDRLQFINVMHPENPYIVLR